MANQIKTCCVTGHRDIPSNKWDWVREQLMEEVDQAIKDGFEWFISGVAEGVDLLFVECVLARQKTNPDLILEAAIPYAARIERAGPIDRALIESCNVKRIICRYYSKDCFFQRNRYMVDHSHRVIVVSDGRPTGGTAYTIRYAYATQKETRTILYSPPSLSRKIGF